MSPRVGPIEIPAAAKNHPGREPSDPPEVEFDPEEKSTAANVLALRTPRFAVSAPTAVVVALIGFAGAWLTKPSGPTVALSESDREALQACRELAKDVAAERAEAKAFRSWVEPQIGLLLVRLDQRVYAPAPPVGPAPTKP